MRDATTLCSSSPTDCRRARAAPRQPVLANVIPALRAEKWNIGPLVIVRHGRVAVGDVIASLLGSEASPF